MSNEDLPLDRDQARCRDGAACVEVTARTDRAHQMIYSEGCREHGEELLRIAQRIAAAHLDEAKLYDPPERES